MSGKGAAAALYGALVSGMFRSMVRREHSPGKLLRQVNQELMERQNDPSTFAAAAYLRWTAHSKRLVVANSGLPMPLLLRDGKAQELSATGIPLGMFMQTPYEEVRALLGSGDLVVVASDGVIECAGASDEEYGPERLKEVVGRCDGCSAEQAIQVIVNDLARHSEGAEATDDQTLMVIKVE